MKAESYGQSAETEQMNAHLERILDLTETDTKIETIEDELMFAEGAVFYNIEESEKFGWKLRSLLEIYLQDRARLEKLLVSADELESNIRELSDEQLIDFIQFLFGITKNLNDQLKLAERSRFNRARKSEADRIKLSETRDEFINKVKGYFFVESFPRLEELKKYSFELFKKKVSENPEILGLLVKTLHAQQRVINEQLMDGILEIPSNWEYEKDDEGKEFLYHGTSYELIKQILKSDLFPKQGTTYDIGAGYGRFVLYKSLLTNEPVKAVEKQHERAKLLKNLAAKFKIDNLEVLEQDALGVNYSGGDTFYLYNPFGNNKEMEQAFVRQLLETTASKKVRVFWFGSFVSSGQVDPNKLKIIKDDHLEKCLVKVYESVAA
jgi:predicted RNA methylase